MNSLDYLTKLNKNYLKIHQKYEDLFRAKYMWNNSITEEFKTANQNLENFRTNITNAKQIKDFLNKEKDEILIERLKSREYFFKLYQIPSEVKELKKEIIEIETKLQSDMANQKTWYIDPKSNKFIKATNSAMKLKMSTEKNEKMRKACFDGIQKTAKDFVPQLTKLVKMRNQYAKNVGYKNFYEYKTQMEERMNSEDVFKIFDDLSQKLIKKIEKSLTQMEIEMPKIRQARNFSYLIAGDFMKEEDQYFPMEDALKNRKETFSKLGINYKWVKLNLDLLERDGKYNNGFMHQPIPPHQNENKRNAGQINFTCNAIPGQVGSGVSTLATLFHEWWHAAHHANITQEDIINATEYAPSSVARAETQSMFLEEIFYSIERRTKYAQNKEGQKYPLSLYEKKVKKLQKLNWRNMLNIAAVVKFEEKLYTSEEKNITEEFIIQTGRKLSKKFFGFSENYDRILTVPHIYARWSSAYYHWYGMATLAFHQRREYFYKKNWYIVDNKKIWKEMTKVRKYWSSESFQSLIKKATKHELSPFAYLNNTLKTEEEIIKEAKKKIKTLCKYANNDKNKSSFNAEINIVEWNKTITNNKQSNKQMYEDFTKFLKKNTKQDK